MNRQAAARRHALHVERVSGKRYYGAHATGQAVLVNGAVMFHGSAKDAKSFETRIAKGHV